MGNPSDNPSDSDNMAEWPMAGLWLRPEGGFEWVHGEPFPDRFGRAGGDLVPLDAAHDPGPWLSPKGRYGKPYSILRRRASLYRDFANLGKDASPARILTFANKWGFLGVGGAFGPWGSGESLSAWQQSARRVAVLTGLWQLVKARDVDRLSDFVEWGPDGDYVQVRIPHVAGRLRPDLITLYDKDIRKVAETLKGPGDAYEQPILADKGRSAGDPWGLLERWTFGDVLEPVRYYVCREVNKALDGHIDRVVLPYLDGGVHYVPDSLLAAVYVAFQDVIAGAVRAERECLNCGSPFTPTRKDKRYCNDNCAKRASDRRRAEQRKEGE